MSEIIFVVENAPEGGFSARAVGESIFTEAETVDELGRMVVGAIQLIEGITRTVTCPVVNL